MFKTIIQFLKANTLLASISKVVLVTTVSISSVSASAYIIDSISAPEENDETETFISTNVESDESIEVETNQVEEEVQTSASKSTENDSGLKTFIADIVTGASKLVESTIGFISGNGVSDVTTGSSRQSSTTVSTNPITNEDTSTGSSRNNGTTPGLVYNDDDYDDDEFEDEDRYEDDEDEHEDEEDEEDEDEHEDEEEHEEDEDREDE